MTTLVVFPPNFKEISNAKESTNIIVNLKPKEISTTIKEVNLQVEKNWHGTIAFNWDTPPTTLETLKANNISINDLSSKSMDDLSHIKFDAVITLCGNAHKEPCPIWVGDCIKDHWGFEDPSAFTDGPEKDKAFQDLFDKLKRVISRLDELIQNNPELIATHIKHIKETLV